jgi:hypothetical protein
VKFLTFFFFRFVDRDMVMRFMGGGVGHKATNAFTQVFAREARNLSADPVDNDPLEDENQEKDLEGAGNVEEEDYGYVVTDSDGGLGRGCHEDEERGRGPWWRGWGGTMGDG